MWQTLVQERLVEWGRCVNVQRMQQRITAADLCRRMGISEATEKTLKDDVLRYIKRHL
jgi:hypothetical protein